MRSTGLRSSNAELWGGAIWLAISLFIIEQGRRLEIGSVNEPGMGFMMFWIGLFMAGMALAIAVQAVRTEGPSVRSLWAGTQWPKTIIVVCAFVAYAFAFSRLGFLLSTIPLMLILLRAVNPVRWSLALPIGVGVPLLIWWVLKSLLQIQLPGGWFEIG
ncbi:MAG TPA: tripartite tricarboxylate transporter TctB family protein [Xanthobacteraceae bacterium]|nr:tripartite tricarboxylate transporter TctB family protein [Xanthobacteraceae bacterium]